MTKQRYRSLESLIRDHLEGKTTNEDEVRVTASSDPQNTSNPTEKAPDSNSSKKKKKDGTDDTDDPHSITIGKVTPVTLEPTTDQPKTTDLDDRKDKKIVEEKKILGKGIHFGNYHRSIRKRVL